LIMVWRCGDSGELFCEGLHEYVETFCPWRYVCEDGREERPGLFPCAGLDVAAAGQIGGREFCFGICRWETEFQGVVIVDPEGERWVAGVWGGKVWWFVIGGVERDFGGVH